MAESHLNISSSLFPPASNDGAAELNRLTNSELFTFLESSFRRSEFSRVAEIVKCREELAKAEALKDLSAKLSHLEAKNCSLEKELHAIKNNEAVWKLENEITKEKGRYLSLMESYEKMEKLAQENNKALMEEVGKARANCLRLQEQLEGEKSGSARIADVNAWKSKYSLLEAWILRFLENNPHLVEQVREQDMNENKQNVNFFRINKAAGEKLGSNAASDKKKSFLAATAKSNSAIDSSSRSIECVGGLFEDKSSGMKYSFDNGDDKSCSKRKFQNAQTSGPKGTSELGDEDDVICISE